MSNVTPVGGEFLVNTNTLGGQYNPKVTSLANGGFVVSWQDNGGTLGDSSDWSVKAQIFDATGAKVGSEFLVNTNTSGGQLRPTITGLADGGFVVSWQDGTGDGSLAGVKAQLFDASGTKVGNEFLVNTNTIGFQAGATITALADGGFVVSWHDNGGSLGDASGYSIKAQRFDAAGSRVGGELLVNSDTLNDQSNPTITSLASGGFVVSWRDSSGTLGDSSGTSIKAKIFDAAGTAIGGEFLVNTNTVGSQNAPTIAALSNGGFVVGWSDNGGTLGDASGTSIKAQIFDAAGTKVGSEFLVNTNTANDQSNPTITTLADGGFVIGWNDYSATLGDSSFNSVKAQAFDATGARIGGEFLVNTNTTGYQTAPSIAGLADGGFVVSWDDESGTLGDSSGIAIKAQIYAVEASTIEGTAGNDDGIGNPALVGTGGDDMINGHAGNDVLNGADGHDTLNGGVGNDALDGGDGIDTASYAGSVRGVVINLALTGLQAAGPAGRDTLVNIENLVGSDFADTLKGDGVANLLEGGLGADKLYGFTGEDQLVGGDGVDLLNGGDGADSLDGGAGSDKLYGEAGDDVLLDNDGADILDGGAGADVMAGGAGNDKYYVDDAGDVINENTGGGTADWIFAAISYELGLNLEKLTLQPGSGDIDGTGNELNNIIFGNDGANVLNGGAGADVLTGGLGADTFVLDVLGTSAQKDTLKDFVSGTDQIEIDASVFTALGNFGLGTLESGELAYGTKATTADQHLIYNPTTGALIYDSDGVGGAAGITISVLAGHPPLSAGDIILI